MANENKAEPNKRFFGESEFVLLQAENFRQPLFAIKGCAVKSKI